MNCPVCNAPNIDGAAFCDNCGTKLGMPATAQPMPTQQRAPVGAGGGAVCPSCGSPVIPGTAFCDICGAKISDQGEPAPAIVPTLAAAGQVRCASCGTMNEPTQLFCDNCGQPLGVARPGAAPVALGPKLTVAASGATFDLAGKTRAIIGRADPVSGVNPEVDLTAHGGDEGGVSRRHAELSFNGQQWQIKDLNSTNGTVVNGRRLSPDAPQLLKSGDQVRLGKLVLVFLA